MPGESATPPLGAARLAPDGHARRRARARAGRRGSARSRPARKPTSSPSTRGCGAAARDRPRRTTRRARQPARSSAPHPDMVRGAWVRGRRLDGPAAAVRRSAVMTDTSTCSSSGGTVVDGTGAPGSRARSRPATAAASSLGGRAEADRIRASAAGSTPGPCRGARVHRPPQPRRPDDPGRARATSPRSARASRPRSSASTATPTRRSEPSDDLADFLTSTRASTAAPTIALRLAHGRRLPRPARPRRRGQHRLPDRQLGAAHRRRGLGRRRGRRRGDGRPAGAPPRGDGGGRVRPLDRARLPARRLRHDRGAGRRSRRGRQARRHLPHPRPLPARRPRSSTRSGRRSRSGAAAAAPVHITHFYHRATFPGTPEQMLALVDDARAEGLDVTLRPVSVEWASTRLLIMLPPWIQAGGVARSRSASPTATVRARIRAELATRGRLFAGAGAWAELRLGYFARPEHARWEGRTLGDYMRRDRPRPGRRDSATCSWPRTCASTRSRPGRIGRDGRSSPTRLDDRDRRVLIGAKPSPADVRQLPAHPRRVRPGARRLLSLEAAVRQDDGGAGRPIGPDRPGTARRRPEGRPRRVRPGPVRSLATYDDPRRYPAGIPYVIVNGQLVVDGGEHTGALPGHALRRGRPD